MKFHLFQYPLPADPNLTDLNACLNSHKVATVNQQFVVCNGAPMLVFVVETIGKTSPASVSHGKEPSAKIDYREVLNAEDFSLYSRLRDVRKEIADAEGVPVYTIFTNAQLAEMITRKLTSVAGMSGIEGVGKGRLEKHADRFIPVLASAFNTADPV